MCDKELIQTLRQMAKEGKAYIEIINDIHKIKSIEPYVRRLDIIKPLRSAYYLFRYSRYFSICILLSYIWWKLFFNRDKSYKKILFSPSKTQLKSSNSGGHFDAVQRFLSNHGKTRFQSVFLSTVPRYKATIMNDIDKGKR